MKNLAINNGEPILKQKFKEKWPIISEEDIKSVEELMKKGEISYYGLEGKLKEFEEEICKYFNVKYALAVNSGTSSLHSAFFGINLGPGDEILCPTYTFLATVTPIFQCYAKPVLCDCEDDTGNICPKDIEKKITEKTKAIVITHMWGHPCDMDKILEICKNHNLLLIEDCSHAHGATYKGKKVGTFGDVGCFSFQANKIVTGGCAGVMITNDQEIYERACLLGHFRNRCFDSVKSEKYSQYSNTGFGFNYRIHPLAAAIGINHFKDLENRIKIRNENLNYLSAKINELNTCIRAPITREGCFRGAYYGYKPLYYGLEKWGVPAKIYAKALEAEGFDVNIPGSKPLHLLNLFQGGEKDLYSFRGKSKPLLNSYICYKEGDLPKSEYYYKHTISFPTFTFVEKEIIDKFIEAIKKIEQNKEELIEYCKINGCLEKIN
jgi:dTDP-4-amino-4,6-dideoxygalactose transaminase